MKDIAREKALKLLLEYEERHTFPNLALKDALRTVKDQRDRRFITALVYGVLERKITLDHYIEKCCDKKIASLSPLVISVLRMGIYQSFYMEIPESAACNTAVDLVKRMGQSYSAGLVNAVLRRSIREKEELMKLKKASFSVRYSINPNLVDLFLEQYGKETFIQMMEQGCGREETIFLFRNLKKCSDAEFISALKEEGIDLEPTELSGLYKSKSSFSVEESRAYQNGWYHILGYHSAMAALLIPKDSKMVLDLCAAPGGKTFLMAAMTDGLIKAYDLHPHRVELLKKNAGRMGHKNVCAAVGDSSAYDPALFESADFVLCDVPCSGYGMIGKKPDIRYKDTDNGEMISIQKKILENGSRYLKVGGRLVYSTCTIDRRENEDQIETFLKDNPQFSLDEEKLNRGQKLFLPGLEGDGFYIAVLKKGN